MNYTRLVLSILVVVSASLGAFTVAAARRTGVLSELMSPDEFLQPLTVRAVTHYFERSGQVAFFEHSTYGLFADGSSARILRRMLPTQAADQVNPSRILIDFRRGERVLVDDMSKSKSTFFLAFGEKLRNRNEAKSCLHLDKPHMDPVLGYDVVKIRLPHKDRSGKEIGYTESFVAPALNCLVLKSALYRETSGSMLISQTYRVESVQVGSPPKSLFEVPATYVERSPSKMFKEQDRRAEGEIHTECTHKSASELDNMYFRSRHLPRTPMEFMVSRMLRTKRGN